MCLIKVYVFVVDMQSTDDTIRIAKKHKTTIFEEKPIKFADPIRNTYLHKVKTEDLEAILKSLKMADFSLKKSNVSNVTRMSIINSIKLIESDYLNIKPYYYESSAD